MDHSKTTLIMSLNTSTILNNCSQYFGSIKERTQFVGLNGIIWEVHPLSMNKKSSIWNGDDPFNYSIPIFLAQVSITAFVTSAMKFILEPLGVTSFVAQMIVNKIQYFGSMFFLFLIGVKTDIGMVRKSGKMALLVGLFSFYKTYFPEHVLESLLYIAGLTSLSSPHVINSFLADLNLLNSELGRIAVSASTISVGCSMISVFLVSTLKQSQRSRLPNCFWLTFCSCLAIVMVIIYVIRPIMLWEEYVFFIFLTVLVSSLAGEIVGQHYLVGPLILVIVISTSSPFKLMEIKLPAFVRFGTLIPAIYFEMPYQDAIILGLIMNVQGVLDIQIWTRAMSLQLIDREIYGSLVLTMVILTGSIPVIVKFLYDPLRKYLSNRRKTIQHSKPNEEFRVLACVYHEENVPSIITLLESSNATTYSPICVYALHLVQLQGRATPLLTAHKTDPSGRLYAHHNRGIVSVNSYSAISPYNTMHDDICSLGTATKPLTLGSMNCNSSSTSKVAVIFLGGPDDREALAYGALIGDDINVNLTVIRFMHSNEWRQQKSKEQRIDEDTVYAFKVKTAGFKNVKYIEAMVMDGVELISSINRMEMSFDLLIVGREHGEESSELLEAFNGWNEFQELGVIGDMLVSFESKTSGSILVMQQRQPSLLHRLKSTQ
ncbi:hypothetical protein MKX01_030762 [Papaver californicum]|nr:hypothetical protein MKX01_030762 [Papaver californicum]